MQKQYWKRAQLGTPSTSRLLPSHPTAWRYFDNFLHVRKQLCVSSSPLCSFIFFITTLLIFNIFMATQLILIGEIKAFSRKDLIRRLGLRMQYKLQCGWLYSRSLCSTESPTAQFYVETMCCGSRYSKEQSTIALPESDSAAKQSHLMIICRATLCLAI